MKHKINARPALVFVLLLVLVAIVGCQRAGAEKAAVDETGEDEPASVEAADGGTTPTEGQEADARAGDGVAVAKSGEAEARAADGGVRAGGAVVGDSRARAGEAVAEHGKAEVEKDGADARSGKDRVKLKIGGEPGAQFSGSCDLGGENREVSGQVPGRFVYDLDDRVIACEIRSKAETGQLKFSADIGGTRKQKIKATADSVSFSFSGGSLSYATSSNSDGSLVQKTEIISSSSSSASFQSGR